ncbi:glycosyl hydrolase family 28 protein [Microcoleus sp. S13_C5]|uniref:glycosyl hydrolase family 28 protein n=1 Tax=Microcoleus sp. S13_C5 TaxID=3055411 RepID=UPI002FD3CA1F
MKTSKILIYDSWVRLKSIGSLLVLICLAVPLILAVNTWSITSNDNILITYPISKLSQPSSTYSVTVNGQPIVAEKYNSLSYVHFTFAGIANIEITAKENIKKYTLSPKRYNLKSTNTDNKISFSLAVPRKMILHQVNALEEKLFIFADPLEDSPPELGQPNVKNIIDYGVDRTGKSDATTIIQQAINDVSAKLGVLYFPPGIYKIKQLNLKSNMTIYLAGGAVLEATKEINPSYGQGLISMENVNNVKIMGRGAIKGNGSYWRPRGGWYSLILGEKSNNVLVQDIIILDPCVANVWMSHLENWQIYNVKILADPKDFINTDGFDFWSSRNITVENILYLGTDDATSHGGDKKSYIKDNENINVVNSVFYAGGGFKIGTSLAQDFVRNITYENIDVVYADELSGFWPVTGANFENIYFKNIRVEEILDAPKGWGSAALFQWRILVASWEATSSPNNLGYIRNVYVYNLKADDRGGTSSVFEGYDSQRNISNVIFDNLYIGGKLTVNSKDANFDIANQYVDLKFTSSNPTIVNISVIKLYASARGETGLFRVTRTGDTSKELTVNYTIRGTAKNGTDYQTIPEAVTIPAGASEAAIAILPKPKNQQKGLKTVFLSLENLPNSTDYMLDQDFHAAVNIRNFRN